MEVYKMKKVFISVILLASTLISAQDAQSIPVRVFKVNDTAVKITKQYPATIQAQRSVDIIARVSGSLEKRYFKEGAHVRKGQKLYLIEQKTYQADVDSSEAALNRAKALLVKATSDWKRYKKLFESKSISAVTRDSYYYSYVDAKANVKSAEATLENAEIQYGYTQIVAPMDGIVSKTTLNVGNYVNANTKLTTITKVNPVYVEFSMPQEDVKAYLNQVKSDQVSFFANCENKCIAGMLDYVSPTIDSSTDTISLRAQFENIDDQLIVGQFTSIKIENILISGVISIPEVAIMQNSNVTSVYVVDENSNIKVRNIELTGETSKDGVIVKSGLKTGEQIVISNLAKLKPNAKISIVEGK